MLRSDVALETRNVRTLEVSKRADEGINGAREKVRAGETRARAGSGRGSSSRAVVGAVMEERRGE